MRPANIACAIVWTHASTTNVEHILWGNKCATIFFFLPLSPPVHPFANDHLEGLVVRGQMLKYVKGQTDTVL